MPFDALVRSPCTLADAAFDLGITPIPAEVLAEHKRTEQAKYPPASVLYPYITLLRAGIIVISLVGLVAGVLGIFSFGRILVLQMFGISTTISNWPVSILALTLFPAAMYASTRVIRGPAEWVEDTSSWARQYASPLSVSSLSFLRADIPEPVFTMALLLLVRTPGAEIMVGELRQNSVVLDPYLVVRTPTEEVCLGIWNGKTILHQATQRPRFS